MENHDSAQSMEDASKEDEHAIANTGFNQCSFIDLEEGEIVEVENNAASKENHLVKLVSVQKNGRPHDKEDETIQENSIAVLNLAVTQKKNSFRKENLEPKTTSHSSNTILQQNKATKPGKTVNSQELPVENDESSFDKHNNKLITEDNTGGEMMNPNKQGFDHIEETACENDDPCETFVMEEPRQNQDFIMQELAQMNEMRLNKQQNMLNAQPSGIRHYQTEEVTSKDKKNYKRKAPLRGNNFDDDDDDDDDDDFSELDHKYQRIDADFVMSEETLRQDNEIEYDIIDDLDLSNDLDYDGNLDCTSESDGNDVPEDEIDAMLDEGLNAYRRRQTEDPDDGHGGVDEDDLSHEEREKVVLKVRGHDHFEILPEGWIEVTHNSGMPVYLHKMSRVCTLSKPYFLGPGSARKHEIPITAIPCLHYRHELDKEKSGALPAVFEDEPSRSEGGTNDANADASDESKGSLPSAKIETVLDNNKEKSLDYLNVRDYCQRLFEFQTITVRRFKTWAGRRKHQKLMKQLQRPTLPSGTKLITCPLPPCSEKDEAAPVKPRREFTMNPNGKSHVCILHEYVQHAMRVQPKYSFKELENAKKPYGATVIIKDMEYGTGYGSSKKQAKSEAAKATLEILIPQIKNVNSENINGIMEHQDLAFFDEVRIEDPRISELCAKAGQPSPYQILLECLKRNYGMGDTEVKLQMHTLKHQKNEFTMKVGKHEAKVICKNKRDGKQRASQAILQSLHPHIRSWGSLLRLYGKGSCKTLKEKKLEEQQITELQNRASANRPNVSILNKLKDEMVKLKEKKEAVKPIGKFKPGDLELPSDSGSNLKNLDL